MDLYGQGPAAIYFATLPQQAEKMCKLFTGAILQTRSSLQLLLTVELYGREPADDVHAFNVVLATGPQLRRLALQSFGECIIKEYGFLQCKVSSLGLVSYSSVFL